MALNRVFPSSPQLFETEIPKLSLLAAPAHLRHPAVLQILDTVPFLLWTARRDGTCDYFNSRWLEFTGMKLSDASERGWSTAIHTEDRESAVARWNDAINFRAPFEAKARVYRFDGEHRWFVIQ